HDRAPRIEGVYDRWKENELWAHDSNQFLSAKGVKKLCRCVGKMKREKSMWRITVLNIWEATWDDIEHVRGIACAWCVGARFLLKYLTTGLHIIANIKLESEPQTCHKNQKFLIS